MYLPHVRNWNCVCVCVCANYVDNSQHVNRWMWALECEVCG